MFKIVRTFLLIVLLVAAAFSVRFFDLKFQVPEPIQEDKSPGAGIIHNKESELEEKVVSNSIEFSGQLDDIIRLANEARKEKGIAPLQRNEKLMSSALSKAMDMKQKNYFEHISPQGLQPWFFVEQAGYKYKTVGENLAEGYFSAQSVHNAWMESEGHRKNIMSAEFEEIGIAVIPIEKNGFHSFLSVQHFGTLLKQEDLKVVTVCDLDSKENCEDAEDKKEEIKKAIKKQEEYIEEGKDNDFSEKDLRDLYENLERLEDIKDELDDYLDECEEFIEKCDEWE